MKEWTIFGLILLAFFVSAFWEAYIECEYVGASRACDWTFKIGKKTVRGYHVLLWFVTFPLLLSLPLVLNFSWQLFRFIIAGYLLGSVLQDFMWFVVNPRFPFKDWNPQKAGWYQWIKIGKFQLPAFYLPYIIAGFALLYFNLR